MTTAESSGMPTLVATKKALKGSRSYRTRQHEGHSACSPRALRQGAGEAVREHCPRNSRACRGLLPGSLPEVDGLPHHAATPQRAGRPRHRCEAPPEPWRCTIPARSRRLCGRVFPSADHRGVAALSYQSATQCSHKHRCAALAKSKPKVNRPRRRSKSAKNLLHPAVAGGSSVSSNSKGMHPLG